MSPPTGRSQNEQSETLTTKCETCAYNINKNQAVCRCISFDKTMHMTLKCTKMSEQVVAALHEVNVDILLLCVSLNKGDNVIDAVKSHQNNKTSADNQEVLTSVPPPPKTLREK